MRTVLLLLAAIALALSPVEAPALEDFILEHSRQAGRLAAAGQYREALQHSRQALQLAEQELGPDDSRLSPLINQLAVGLYRRGRYREAAACFERALELKRQVLSATDPQLALALANLAAAYRALGRLSEAESLQRRALGIDRRAYGPDHPALAEDLNNLAAILQDKEDYPQALELLRRALTILAETPDPDARLLTGMHNNLGLLFKLQGRFEAALRHLELARQEAGKAFGEQHPALARIAANLAALYRETGDLSQAEACYRLALEIDGTDPGGHSAETGLVLNGYASLLAVQNRLDEARGLFLRALELQRAAQGSDHGTVAALYNNLGELELQAGNLAKAEEYLLKASAGWQGDGPPRATGLAACLHNLGRLHVRQGRLREAEAALRRALRLTAAGQGRDHYQNVALLANLADILKRRGELKEAATPLRTALNLARESLPADHPQVAELLNSLAALHFAENRPDLAERYSRQATEAVKSRLRRRQSDRAERRLLRHILLNRVALLKGLAATAPDRETCYIQQAFETAQWAYISRAGAALEQLAARFAAGEGELAGLIRRRQDSLTRLKRLEGLYDRFLVSPPEHRSLREGREIRRQMTLTTGELADLTARLEQAFPRYAELEMPTVVNLAEAQNRLGPQEALLFFLTGEGESYLWCVTRQDRFMATIPLGALELKDRVRGLLAGLNQPDVLFAEDLRPFDLALAQNFYRELIGPVEERLQGVSRLITVVDGDLLRLPLSVLVRSFDGAASSAREGYRTADWMIDHWVLRRLPTVSGLVHLRQNIARSRADQPFIGFGDPLPAAPGPEIPTLPRLPETARELQALARLMGAKEGGLFLGKAATEKQIAATRLDRYRVLAFASHALTAEDLPGLEEPALVLTPPQTVLSGEDGLLTASEIARLRLDAELVILSACNTAAADGSAEGEGLSGLARAFFYAGSRGVLASHWPVGSEATAGLMTRFVHHWRKNERENLAEALAAAMREMRRDPDRDLSHPLFWAPFLVIGQESLPSTETLDPFRTVRETVAAPPGPPASP